MLVVLELALMKLIQSDIMTTEQIIFGGTALYTVIMKTGFMLSVLLWQYLHAEMVVYCIRNIDYLCIRYGTKKKTFELFCGQSIMMNIVFVVLGALSVGFAGAISGQTVQDAGLLPLADAALRGLCKCCMLSMIQFFLFMKLEEERVFACIVLIAFVFSVFTSYSDCFGVKAAESLTSVYGYAFYLAVIGIGTYIVWMIFEKEWGGYANTNR